MANDVVCSSMSMRTVSNQRWRTAQAETPPNTAKTVRMRMAHRQRFAHFSSTSRSMAMISLRLPSVVSGIHVVPSQLC